MKEKRNQPLLPSVVFFQVRRVARALRRSGFLTSQLGDIKNAFEFPMRRHFLFAEDEKERSVGEGKANLLRLWHNRRNAMLEGDECASGGEANALVARELTLLWDLAKLMTSCTLSRDGYVAFFARAAKALVLPLSSDGLAIAAAQRDWEYDLEGAGGNGDPTTKAPSSLHSSEVMSPEQFREAVMQLAEMILPVESAAGVYLTFFRELRNSVAEIVVSRSSSKPEQDAANSADPGDRFTLRPLKRIPKIANDAFLQKVPPSSAAMRSIRGLQPPDQREMSLKQLLVSYSPRKFSLTRAFPAKMANADANGSTVSVAEEAKTDTPKPDVEDDMEIARRLHVELMGSIGSGATPVRVRQLHRETAAHWNPEDALTAALTDCPALRVAVVGPPGCGKTRLARVLARRRGLKYLSLDGAVQRAVYRKLRLRRRRTVAAAPAEGEESSAETPPPAESTQEDEQVETDDADEEMDRVFRDEHLDALCAGNAFPRESALAVLRIEATRSLLAGVGVVLDDVYPSELSASDDPKRTIAADYLIALTSLPSEIEYQLKGSELAPVAGRLYSVRELATLKTASSEELAATGFADFLLPPKKPEAEAEVLPEPATIAENGEAGPHIQGQEVDESSPEENDQDGYGDSGQDAPEEPPVPPTEPTPAERNEIEPPTEPTLPFGSMAAVKLAKGYHEFVTRMQRELSVRRAADAGGNQSNYHLVVVLATQALSVIRDHCIQAITGTSLGLSRYSISREACPISLPEDLNSSSRGEKVRWLLYGDWSALLEAEASETFARLPKRDAKRRLLSKWREFCPVMSTFTNTLKLGEPEFAAGYSGRVYFLTSQAARRDFCAHPLRYLRQDIPVSSTHRNFWLVTTGAGEVFTPSYLETLEAGLHVLTVSPSKLLKNSPSISTEMRLMGGQIVSPVEAATVAAEAAKALLAKSSTPTGWMITDLPLTRDVAAVLLEHGCVPDAILLVDREVAAAQEQEGGTSIEAVSALSVLRRQQFQAEKAGADDISQGLGSAPRVITCPLFRQPGDTLAAIERELNPIAPRLDSIEDGHSPQLVDEYDPAVIFAPPVPEKDEESQDKQKSAPEEGEGEVEVPDPDVEAQAEAARNRALQLQGECGRFCPVSWRTRGLLIPGQPSNVCSFRQKFYAFAGQSERRTFERNPAAFIPNGPCATTSFVPCVLILGVRGSGRGRIAAALAQPQVEQINSPADYVNVDLATVAKAVERNQLLEELKPEDARLTAEEIFVRALQLELQRHPPTHQRSAAQIVAGLGLEASRIPNAATLEMCFKNGLFPALVVPLTVSEDIAANTLLGQWTANLPAPRRKLALMRKKEFDGEADDDGTTPDDAEKEEPIDLEAAREEESTRLREQFAEDQKALDEAVAGLRARGIRVCDPVDATSAPRQMVKYVRRILDEFTAGRDTLFESCEVLDMTTGGKMHQMLASGELFVGKHGLVCPVTGRTDSVSANSMKAVAHRDQLYFPRSREAQRAFMSCPSRYLDKASQPPKHQPTCCVVGPPLSGKTSVARELANALGLVYVSPKTALDWVVQCQGGSTLRCRLLEIMQQQQDPLANADVTHEAICARLRSSECQARGWALDGYLLQRHELQRSLSTSSTTELVSQSIRPDMLFVLERGFASVWTDHQAHVEQNELRAAFARWHHFRLELLDTWTRRFGIFHLRQLDTSSNSLWHVAAQAQAFLREQQQLASQYTRAMACNRAARSLGVVRTREELQARQHPIFQTFCPVELHAGKFDNSRESNRDLCVDFRGSSFWFGNERSLQQFVESPEAFVGYLPDETPVQGGDESWPTQEEAECEAQTLVARAPVNASLVSLLTVPDCDFPEMKGYCPVTFASGSGAKDWAALRHGSVFFRASYRSKVYFFVSEEARRQFCVEPSRYTSQSLPMKLPPQVTLAKSYPGQLEQQLGAALNEVLLALGSERPKFPQMSTRASACVYLALSLKALQRRYQLQMKPDPRSPRDEPDEEQKQRQERREDQVEQEAIARRDAFVNDCRLGEKLKTASTPAHPSCGSGAMVARSMRAADDEKENCDLAVPGEDVELLHRRFDAIVSGSVGDDTALSVDPHVTRTHARAAFLEYTKTSTPS
ncbi:adenylate kinase [Phytophthora pseudosyringae]|uniref:Cilia- and flagella-associated protein 206 n=1 Tax=Phytophthora pseudosyringae TaxID=221518 RepID=A0A8T1VJQ0_9STRA|nr:adenylate kinase [Phytophthora pseudosyringae]